MHRPSREIRELGREPQRGRSKAYAYVRLHLGKFVKLGIGTADGPSWQAVALSLARAGVANRNGEAISAGSARKIFERVFRDVAKAEEAAKAGLAAKPPRKLQPRDMPKDWRPVVISPTHPPPARAASTAVSQVVNNVNCTPEEAWAGIIDVMAERSGR